MSCAVERQILDLNYWQFEREFNSASPPLLLLLAARIFHTTNYNFVKDEFVCTNEIFHIFQFLVQMRPKFSISICDSLKENSILHLLLFFFYSQHEFFIRKILNLSKLNSSARMKFSLFFISCAVQTPIFIRKRIFYFLLLKLNSSARMKFSLFFNLWQFLVRFSINSISNSRSEFVTVWKRIQFCTPSFSCSTLRRNFS